MSNKTEAIKEARKLTLDAQNTEALSIEWRNTILRVEESQSSKKAIREIRRDNNIKKLSNDGVSQTDKSKIPLIDTKQACANYAILAHKRAEKLYALVIRLLINIKKKILYIMMHIIEYAKRRKHGKRRQPLGKKSLCSHFCI